MPRVTTCRSCRARIYWAHTDDGKRMPIDEMPASTGNVLLTRDRHDELHVRQVLGPLEEPPEGWSGQRYVCHFETCPDAGAWRKHKREKTKQTQGRLL